MESLQIHSPWFVFAFFVPAVFIFFVFFNRKKLNASMFFPFTELVGKTARFNVSISSFLVKIPLILRFIALLLIAAALMRFQDKTPLPLNQTNYSGTDIIICLDTSPSMLALDFNPQDRLTVAKEVVGKFIDGRRNDRIGLVVFSGAAITLCPLTIDYKALQQLVSSVTEKVTQTDGTAIGDALAVSINRLKNSSAKSKIIILVTDGRSNMGEIDPVSAADMAKRLDIKIYTIGVATEGESIMPQKERFTGRTMYLRIADDLDEDTLTQIADNTGGFYARGTDISSLESIFKEIDKLEKTVFKAKQEYTYKELYNFFLLPALVILLLEFVLSKTLCRKIP